MKTKRKQIYTLVALMFTAGIVSAGPTYFFSNISNNNPVNAATGQAQLSVELVDLGSGSVKFLFKNAGPNPSSITDIYFDNGLSGALSGPISFVDGIGNVAFSSGAAPGNLPGGIPYGFSSDLSADSDAPVQPKGVNPGEQIGLSLSGNYADVASYLNGGDLRIGLHVQGFADGGSESFINNTPDPVSAVVPAPGSVLLAGIGISFVGFLRKRKNASLLN